MPADRVPAELVADVAGAFDAAPDPLHDALAGTPGNAIGSLYNAAEAYRELLKAALDALHITQVQLQRERDRRFALVEELRRRRGAGRAA